MSKSTTSVPKKKPKLQVSPHLQRAASLMSDNGNMFASGGLFH